MDDMNIRAILAANGFTFRKGLGQNFITDTNLLRDIARLSGAGKEDTVVEIGCGAGTLTRELAAVSKYVYAFEVDERLGPVLSQTLSGVENCEVIFRDFLKVPTDRFEEVTGMYTVAANLPYYITAPLIMKVLDESVKCTGMCVMVQEEVARRICAAPGTSDYGAMTAQIALRGEGRIVKRVKRDMFFPRPNVDSAVVKIDITDSLEVRDRDMYRRCVKAAFAARRKTLENNLVASFSMTRDMARGVISELGFPADIRGEMLSPADFSRLSEIIGSL